MGGQLKFLVCGLLLVATGAGCSSGEEKPDYEVFPVSGLVTVNGEPAKGVSVTFLPEQGVPGPGGFAGSGDDGRFTVMMSDGQEGLPAGSYRVLLTQLLMPDGSPIPEGAMAADVGAQNHLPPQLNDPTKSPYQVTVEEGGTDSVELDIKAK